MNKLILIILFIGSFLVSKAKDIEKFVQSDIKEVTVYLNGAQVTNVASVNLAAGTTNVVFEDITQFISNDNNIQVKAEGGNVTILSVVRKLNYINNDNNLPKEQQAMEDTLEALTDRKTLSNNMIKVYEQEEQMLMANKSIGGTNTGVSVVELEKAANLLRNRLMDIQSKKMELQRNIKNIDEKYNALQKQLNQLNTQKNKTTSEITVSVSCKAAATTKLMVSYMVNNAGWEPYYDVRAIDSNNPIKLEYKAHVWQNTGYDWDNVYISLSTGNPSQSATQPKLTTWWINAHEPYQYNYQSKGDAKGYGYTNMQQYSAPVFEKDNSSQGGVVTSEDIEIRGVRDVASYTTVTESQTTTTFDISIPYSVPSDNKQYSVAIQDYDIPATYQYFSVPKIDKDAFLMGRITDWEKYNLMSASANIYYEGMYIGNSYINTRNTSDTLDISLGRDKNVLVTRVKLQDFCEKKTIGTTKKETYAFEITVRNNKKQNIEIALEDQIPFSQNKEVEVELIESTSAIYDNKIGKLSWPLKLAAGETKKIKLSYSVKYPKDKVIDNL